MPSIMLLLTVLSLCFAPQVLAKSPKIRTLGTLPRGTWLENIAVRPNGGIITTQLFPNPNIWTVRKPESDCTSLELLNFLPTGDAAIGITQIEDTDGYESYVVTGGNFTFNGHIRAVAGSFTAYKLQFVNQRFNETIIEKITDLGSTSLAPNGIINTKKIPGAVFIADCYAGNVGRLNVTSGLFEPALWSLPEMQRPNTTTEGINGIKIYDSHLYWSNSVLTSIFKVALSPSGYPVPGAKAKLVADLSHIASILDDFEIDRHGNIYAATNFDNDVIYVDGKTGKSNIAAGGLYDFAIEGISSVAIGKDTAGEMIMYGATSGGVEAPIHGISQGPKVASMKWLK